MTKTNKKTSKSILKEKSLSKGLSNGARYFEGVGRRKSAVARVRLYPSDEEKVTVNGLDYQKYFPLARFRQSVTGPLRALREKKGEVTVSVRGGGVMAQSEATQLGLARALVKFDPNLKKELRAFGYLTRDPRMVERKKYGLKKARRAPQWTKR